MHTQADVEEACGCFYKPQNVLPPWHYYAFLFLTPNKYKAIPLKKKKRTAVNLRNQLLLKAILLTTFTPRTHDSESEKPP